MTKQAIHEYLKEHHPGYDKEETNYQIDKITEKKLKPILCKTLQRDGYCKGICSNIGEGRSPISLLFKTQCIPLVSIEQDIRTLLTFIKGHKLSGSEQFVAMCLISYKNDQNNVVFPSIDTIALDTGL
jgi:hypothetical protein